MVKTVEIEDWQRIADILVEDGNYIFRGQSDSNWELDNSLRRSIYPDYKLISDIENVEYWCLYNFKRSAANYLDTVPDDNDTISWLSLMQHHGTPTRLIDFTYSFYIACHFALTATKTDAAVWAIDQAWLFRKGGDAFERKNYGLRDIKQKRFYQLGNTYIKSRIESANTTSSLPPKKGVLLIHQKKLSLRQSAQQSLHILPLDNSITVSENINQMKLDDHFREPVVKYIIKKEMRYDILTHLNAMNITEETLFPGIDGFARSILKKYVIL